MISAFLLRKTVVLVCGLLCALPAYAKENQVRLYTVYGISVDETATTANEARTLAITKAENEAWQRLVAKLTSKTDASRVFPPSGALISDYILGFDVVEEKNSRVRYVAKINVSFDPEKIQSLFSEKSIPYVLFSAAPVLVVPIWITDGTAHLWEDSNLFRVAWQNADRQNRLTDVRLPEGTLDEQLNVTAEALLGNDSQQILSDLAARYEVQTVERMVAEGTHDPLGNLTELVVTVMGDDQQEQYVLRVRLNPGQDTAPELDRVVDVFLTDRDLEWKRLALASDSKDNDLEIVVKASSVGEWAETMKSLRAVSLVRVVEPRIISYPNSQVLIRYQGTFEQLQLALKLRGLVLRTSRQGWTLARNLEE